MVCLLYNSPADFLSSSDTFSIGDRVSTRDGNAYDIVSSGEDFIHPISGAKLKVVAIHGIFDVLAFGAKGDGVTDDTDSIQATVNAAAARRTANYGVGSPTVYFPPGTYKLTARGTVENPAFDDGTGTRKDYNQATAPDIAAETPVTQAYCVLIPSVASLNIVGAGRTKTTIAGTWLTTSGATTALPAAFAFDKGNGQYQWGSIKGICFSGHFIGLMMLDCHFIETEFDDLLFQGCGVSILTYKLERPRIGSIHFYGCVTGWVNGGQWRTRCDDYTDDGGWADKASFEHLTGQSFHPITLAIPGQIDTWFDTYFFKTVNNTNRKYPIGGVGTPATRCPYRGISGRTLTWLSRYHRPNVSNTIFLLTHMGSARPALQMDGVSNLRIVGAYLERVGYVTVGVDENVAVGDGLINDPYISGRPHDPLLGQLAGVKSPLVVESLEVQHSAGLSGSPFGQANVYVETILKSNVSEIAGTGAGANRSSSFVDAGQETISSSKTWAADQATNGYMFGHSLNSGQWIPIEIVAGNSVSTIPITLPRAGAYLITATASGNGGHLHEALATFLVNAEINNVSDYFFASQQIGITQRASGTLAPNTIEATAPDASLSMTIKATKNGTGSVTQLYFRVKAIRLF